MEIGERIRLMRKRRGWTQKQLGEHIGASASAVGMYEQGRRVPDALVLGRLCQALQASAASLVGEREFPGSRDLEQLLDGFCQDLADADGLLFQGEPLSREDVDLVAQAVQQALRLALGRPQKEDEPAVTQEKDG